MGKAETHESQIFGIGSPEMKVVTLIVLYVQKGFYRNTQAPLDPLHEEGPTQ